MVFNSVYCFFIASIQGAVERVTLVEELVLTTQHKQFHHSIICEPVTKGASPGINLANPQFYISKDDFFHQGGIGLVCCSAGLPEDAIQAATQWGCSVGQDDPTQLPHVSDEWLWLLTGPHSPQVFHPSASLLERLHLCSQGFKRAKAVAARPLETHTWTSNIITCTAVYH